jgi:hypothetical protein
MPHHLLRLQAFENLAFRDWRISQREPTEMPRRPSINISFTRDILPF